MDANATRPFVILRIDLRIVDEHPAEGVTVTGFASDRALADREVARLNEFGRTDRIYFHRVARGIEDLWGPESGD